MRPAPALRTSALLLALAAIVSGCTTMAGGGGGGALAPALTARMDTSGAALDRAGALALINSYRATRGVAALTPDPALDAEAEALADAYAASGSPPRAPGGRAVRFSAGYPTFADTFSGWRNSPADAAVLAQPSSRRGGIAVTFDPGSAYGTHWVLLLAD